MTAENFDMEELLQYVEERKFRLLRSRLAEMNEADIAEFMEELDDNKKVLIFRMLPKDQAADAFAFLEPDIQQHISTVLPMRRSVRLSKICLLMMR